MPAYKSKFDELSIIEDFVKENLRKWNFSKVSNQEKWIEIFHRCKALETPIDQMSLLVEFAFSLPGTSTEVERLFSMINDAWSSDKGQMKLETLEAVMNIKYNSKLSCSEFHDTIKNDSNFLEKSRNSEKYLK